MMDDYEYLHTIGHGSYGTVSLQRRRRDGRLMAIKQIVLDDLTPDQLQVSVTEVQVLSLLGHPNIVRYHSSMRIGDAVLLVMDFLPGGTLQSFLNSRLPSHLLQEQDAVHLFAQAVAGLSHIHSRHVLHRDLKTQNILLDSSHRNLKIADFGISKMLSSKSKAHSVVGTPCCLSPELCREQPYNQKSDIWALGCVLYELLTLRRAFQAESLPALVLRIMRGVVAPVSAQQYSAPLRELLTQRLLHLQPSQRPTASQILCDPIVISTMLTLHTDQGRLTPSILTS